MKRYSEEEKAEILLEVESVGNVNAVARKHNIPQSTIQSWLKRGLKRKKDDLVSENRTLKKELCKKDLEIAILKDLVKKTHQVFAKE
jgi:transposase-like protein